MNIRLFTLCDGAHNYNGRLTVVGTTDNVRVQNVPSKLNIGLAIKVSFPPSEYGEKKLIIKVCDNEGTDVMPEIALPSTIASARDGEEARLVLAGNLHGINITKEGWYYVKMYINDIENILPFRVLK